MLGLSAFRNIISYGRIKKLGLFEGKDIKWVMHFADENTHERNIQWHLLCTSKCICGRLISKWGNMCERVCALLWVWNWEGWPLNPFPSRDAFTLSATIPIPSTVFTLRLYFSFFILIFCLPSYVSQVIHAQRKVLRDTYKFKNLRQSEQRI